MRSFLNSSIFFAGLAFTAIMPACTDSSQSVNNSEKIIAVATTTIVADLVENIAGDRAEVLALMGPGVDPHLYKASATDISKLSRSTVIFYSGLMLEGKMADIFTQMSRQGKRVYAVTESIDETRLLEPPEFQGHWDPHVWGDAELWSQCIETVVLGLSESDPAGADIYRENGEVLKAKYLALHDWARSRVQELPEAQRILITSHDAFNYFGRAYGFQVVGVQGISTVTEAGLADMTKTVDFIKANEVRAIFVESSVSPAAIERISQDAGVKIGGELFSDALGTPGEVETRSGETYDPGTYEGYIKHNILTTVEALK